MKKGCLIAIVLTACLSLGFCAAYNYHAAHSKLPPELEIAEVLVYNEESVTDACVFAAYRLTAKGVANIPHAGLSEQTPAHIGINDKNMDDLPDGTHLYAMGAAGGCRNPPSELPNVYRSLSEPGSRFEVINGGEGLIVADPKRGLAWFLYFG
jgi:hypothetical protein